VNSGIHFVNLPLNCERWASVRQVFGRLVDDEQCSKRQKEFVFIGNSLGKYLR
jgi:hypothetical protein